MAAPAVLNELIKRPEFRLGATTIRPSSREVCGPETTARVEPRIMQVLVMLADAAGKVVSRDDLLRRCWGGQIVGNDVLNRVISKIRQLGKTVGNGSFVIETISKAGYRLIPEPTPKPVLEPVPMPATLAPPLVQPRLESISRRTLVMAGVGLVASATAILTRLQLDGDAAARAATLVARGDAAMRADMPDYNRQGIQYFQQAVALSPNNAIFHARLALAWRTASEFAPPDQRAAAVAACEAAARQAMAINPQSPDALAALALLQPEFGDWFGAERRLRAVLAIDPLNEAASGGLAVLLQGVGRVHEAATLIDRLYVRTPLSPRYTYWRAYSQWAIGDLGNADRAADRGIELWPHHPAIWFARLWTYALTDRAQAAQRMLDDRSAAPLALAAGHVAVIRPSLVALDRGTAANRNAATQANLAAVMTGPSWAVFATMILSKLGELDAAYEVAKGYLLRRGSYIGALRHTAAQPSINDQRHRKTMMLFIPPTSAMREDPRFEQLCNAMGMTAYWKRTGIWPDAGSKME